MQGWFSVKFWGETPNMPQNMVCCISVNKTQCIDPLAWPTIVVGRPAIVHLNMLLAVSSESSILLTSSVITFQIHIPHAIQSCTCVALHKTPPRYLDLTLRRKRTLLSPLFIIADFWIVMLTLQRQFHMIDSLLPSWSTKYIHPDGFFS